MTISDEEYPEENPDSDDGVDPGISSTTEDWKHVLEPGPHDVLYGRGAGTNNHPGNITFRNLINEHKFSYLGVPKLEKPKVAKEIVKAWRSLDPPGRFLARMDESQKGPGEGTVWQDVGDKKARVKVSQCLRERTPYFIPYVGLSKTAERERRMTISDEEYPEENPDSDDCVEPVISYTPEDWKYILEPGPHDVLYGRGAGTNNHPGNIKFRNLIYEHKLRYLGVPKLEKPKVAKEIVKAWRSLDPPGRFLARKDESQKGPASDKGGGTVWQDVGDKKAREKASQCLRERTPYVIPLSILVKMRKPFWRTVCAPIKKRGRIIVDYCAAGPEGKGRNHTPSLGKGLTPKLLQDSMLQQFRPDAEHCGLMFSTNFSNVTGHIS
jgi:hypothetical protein